MNDDDIIINNLFEGFKEYLKNHISYEDVDNLYDMYTTSIVDPCDSYFCDLDRYFYSYIGFFRYKIKHHIYMRLDKKKMIEHALIQIKFNKN
jgi:hypothetical protein